MSCLTGACPSFSKATISLWFRIPKTSIDAAAAAFDAAIGLGDPDSQFVYGEGWIPSAGPGTLYTERPPRMAGIIPLIVFGKAGTSGYSQFIHEKTGFYTYTLYIPDPNPPFEGWVLAPGSPGPIDLFIDGPLGPSTEWQTEPSYIGVWCTADPPRALLAVNLSMADHADITGYGILTDLQASDLVQYNPWLPDLGLPRSPWTKTYTVRDFSPSRLLPDTECFRTHPRTQDVRQYDGTTPESPPFGIAVTPDRWHHLLLSFDLTTPCKTHGHLYKSDSESPRYETASPSAGEWVDSAPKMWIAYDDENKQGRHLSYYWPGKGGETTNPDGSPGPDYPDDKGAAPNEILTPQAWSLAGQNYADNSKTYDNDAGNDVTETWSGVSTPTYDYSPPPLQGQPMGLPGTLEFVSSIRHCEMAEFQMWVGVTLDTNIEANRRAFIDKNGKPVKPAKAEKLLGRKPDILLHGSGNWQKGKNTGTDGQFSPTGVIKAYKPEPSLHGPQSPS